MVDTPRPGERNWNVKLDQALDTLEADATSKAKAAREGAVADVQTLLAQLTARLPPAGAAFYAIPDGDKVVLIDGGWAMAESSELLAAGLATLGYELGDIRDFYVTHMHRDHYTQAIALRRRFGGRVSLGEGERTAIEARCEERLAEIVEAADAAPAATPGVAA